MKTPIAYVVTWIILAANVGLLLTILANNFGWIK